MSKRSMTLVQVNKLEAAAPALLERLKFLRDNFGVALPVEYAEKVINETDALIATIEPGWPKVRS